MKTVKEHLAEMESNMGRRLAYNKALVWYRAYYLHKPAIFDQPFLRLRNSVKAQMHKRSQQQ